MNRINCMNQKSNITPFIKKTYKAYFGIHLGDHVLQDKPFAPHICCKTFTVNLHS